MKFCKAEPFEKHLKQSLPDHTSPLYLLMLPDSFERNFLAQRIVNALGIDHIYVDVDVLLKEIHSPLLFPNKYVCICDDIEKYTEKTIPIPSNPTLILMGKSEPPFMQTLKKGVVILDLVQEKPWERKGRLQRWLLESAHSKGRELKGEVVDYLLQLYHTDFSLLLQELEKVITYAGNDTHLSLKRVQRVTSLAPLQTSWQLAEAFVWGGDVNLLYIQELNNHRALTNQIRYQLHLGLTLALGGNFPKLSPKRHKKFTSLALSYFPSYFLMGLKDLFVLEQRLRSAITDYTLLLEYFYVKLSERRHALSSA